MRLVNEGYSLWCISRRCCNRKPVVDQALLSSTSFGMSKGVQLGLPKAEVPLISKYDVMLAML